MIANYIYLLQEREFIKTNEYIYKVGRTKQENHQRFNQYPKGSILLFQMICNNYENIEKYIIKQFKEKFNLRKDIGNEYFEGDYKSMIDIIYSTVKNEICYLEACNNKLTIDNTNLILMVKNEELKFKTVCEKICEIFPDYKNDESFGGSKKYFKIELINNEYLIYYINPDLEDEIDDYYEDKYKTAFNEYIILQHCINDNVADKLQYFDKLISKKTILIDKIYDINSNKFIDKIKKSKFNLIIENYDEFETYLLDVICNNNNFEEKIRQLFYCNMIINNKLYSTIVKEYDDDNYDIYKLKDFDNFRVDIGIHNYIMKSLYKINLKFYDYEYLRKYIPYLIRWNTNKDYYILNRDYEYIGLNTKSIEYEKIGEIYLFDDETKPWNKKQYFINMCNEYIKIITENLLNRCVNSNNFTENILSLYN